MNSKLLLMCTLIMGTQSLISVKSCHETDPLDLASYLATNGLTVVSPVNSQGESQKQEPVEIRFGNEFSGPAFTGYNQFKKFKRPQFDTIYVGDAWIVKDGAKNYMVHVVPIGQLSDGFLTSRFAAEGLQIEGDFVECLKDEKQYIYRKEYHTLADECLAIEKDQKNFPELIEEFKNNFAVKDEQEIILALDAELRNYFGPIGERKKVTASGTGSQTEIFKLDKILEDIVFKKVPKNILQLNEILNLKKLKTEPTGPGFKFCFYEKEGNHAYVVMEKMEYDLDKENYLNELKEATATQRVEKFAKIAEAFEKFHTFGLVHDDIKPGNIMIDAKKNIRVIDVGISVEEGALSPPASQNAFRPPGRGNRTPVKQTYDVQALSLAFCFLNANAFKIRIDDPQENIEEKYPKEFFMPDTEWKKYLAEELNKQKNSDNPKKLTIPEVAELLRAKLGMKFDEKGEQIAGRKVYPAQNPLSIPQLFQNRIKKLYEQSTKLEASEAIDFDSEITKNFLKDLEEFWATTQFPFTPSLETEEPLSPDAVLTWALLPESKSPQAVKVTMTKLKLALEEKAKKLNLIRIRI